MMSTGAGVLLVGDVVRPPRHRDGAAGRGHHDARARPRAPPPRTPGACRRRGPRTCGGRPSALVRDHPGQVIDLVDAGDDARDVVGRRHRPRHDLDVRARILQPGGRRAVHQHAQAHLVLAARASRTRCAPRNPVPPVTSVVGRAWRLRGFMAPTSARAPAAAGARTAIGPSALPSQAARAASTSSAVATPSRRFSTTRWVNAATSRQASCAGRPSVSAASHSRAQERPERHRQLARARHRRALGQRLEAAGDVRRQHAHLGAQRQVAEAGEEVGHARR